MSSEQNFEGKVLAGKYELVKSIGQGGMGSVWEARNQLGKRVAVKLLFSNLGTDPNITARFFREARACAAVESEHIVEVHDTFIDEDTKCPFIVMEHLKGEDLEHTIQRVGALAMPAACRIICQASQGLVQAHSVGIVHRDIKPANLFLVQRGPNDMVVKILDFGIAKQSIERLTGTEGAGLTKSGSMLGTPLYMSPEQARGMKSIDGRTDVWSIGMCLYEALSGQAPWRELETLGDLIIAICSQDVVPLQNVAPWVPPELAQIVHATLLRDRDQRTSSVAAFLEQVRPFCAGTVMLTPDDIRGVDDTQRSVTAPRLTFESSVGAVSTSTSRTNPEFVHARAALVPTWKRPAVVAATAGVAVLGAVLAVVALRPGHGTPTPQPATSAPAVTEPLAAHLPANTTSPPTPTVPEVKSAAPTVETGIAVGKAPVAVPTKGWKPGKAAVPAVSSVAAPSAAPPPSATVPPPPPDTTVKGRIIRTDL